MAASSFFTELAHKRVGVEILNDIATKLSLQDVIEKKKEHKCFKAIFKQIEKNEWQMIDGQSEQIGRLRNKQGRTLLQEALDQRNSNLANELITKKIAINELDENDDHVIHYIARFFREPFLLQNPNLSYSSSCINKQGQTPLHIAAEKGHVEIMNILIEDQANLQAEATFEIGEVQYKKLTPLSIACINGHYDSIRILLDKVKETSSIGAPLLCGKKGSIIHLLVEFNHTAILETLLNEYSELLSHCIKRKDTNSLVPTNEDGMTPFHLAAYLGNTNALKLLKKRGVDVNELSKNNRNVYHFAILGKQSEVLYTLSHLGCVNFEQRDMNGKAPIEYAREYADSIGMDITNQIDRLIKLAPILQSTRPRYICFPPENLVFKGGGAKGIAFIGAIEELERLKKLSSLKRVAGTSAGAFTSALLATGYSASEISEILINTNLTSFLDHNITWNNLGIYAKYNILGLLLPFKAVADFFGAIKKTTGLCKGIALLNWIEELIAKKTNISHCTFGELKRLIDEGKPYRHLHVFATSLKEEMPRRFSSEDPKCAEIVIAGAVRASMSIPVVFKPYILKGKSAENHLYDCLELGSFVDGGAIYNFPIDAFDQKKYQTAATLSLEEGQSTAVKNNRTLGFSLISNNFEQVDEKSFDNIGQVLAALIRVYYNAEDNLRKMDPDHLLRVIQIDNMGAGALELDIPPEKQQELIDSGRQATRIFFSNQPLNSILPGQAPETLPGTGKVQLRPQCSFFVRRKEILEALEEILLPRTGPSSSSAASISTSPILKAVLTGAPGVGKTEIATYFAHYHSRKFPTVGWIYASAKQSLYQSYQSLANQLEIKITLEEALEELVAKVNVHLKNNHPQPFLLIFDDAHSNVLPPALLPDSGNGVIIITTRQSHDYRGDLRTEIKSFSQDEATALIDKVMPGENLEIKKQIASRFNGSPIELSLAARYLQSSKPNALLELIEAGRIPSEIALTKLHQGSKSRSASAAASSSAQSKSFLSGMVEPGTPLSWLRACSYFLPHQIPINWFRNWIEEYDSKDLDSLQRELLRTGLLDKDKQSSTFFLSNEAQQKIAQFQPDSDPFPFLSNILLPFFVSQTKDADWYSHAEALIKNIPSLTENPSWVEINFELGKRLLKQKDPLQANIFLENALSGFNIMTPDESIKKIAFIRLALSQMELSAQKKQNKIQKEQLAIQETEKTNEKTAKTEYLKDAPRRRALRAHQAAENAAQAAKTANASAIAQLNQAYELVKTIAQNNEKDQDLAIDLLLETGDIFQCVNNQQEALNCYSSALEKLHNKYGNSKNAQIGNCLIKLGTVEIALSRYEQAMEYLSTALTLWNDLHNDENIKEIRLCHRKLAKAYFGLSEFNDAETHFMATLTKWKQIKPGDDKYSLKLYVKIAKTLAFAGKYKEAETQFNLAMAMARRMKSSSLLNFVTQAQKNAPKQEHCNIS